MGSRNARLRRKKLREKWSKRSKPIPITRFCLDVDFYDAGDTWGLAHNYAYKLPEWMGLTGIWVKSSKNVELYTDGRLRVPKDFKFNASGPTIDTEDAVRAACIHDALYHLHDERLIPCDKRKVVDQLFHDMLLEDGMSSLRAGYWYIGVRLGGWHSWNKRRK